MLTAMVTVLFTFRHSDSPVPPGSECGYPRHVYQTDGAAYISVLFPKHRMKVEYQYHILQVIHYQQIYAQTHPFQMQGDAALSSSCPTGKNRTFLEQDLVMRSSLTVMLNKGYDRVD